MLDGEVYDAMEAVSQLQWRSPCKVIEYHICFQV